MSKTLPRNQPGTFPHQILRASAGSGKTYQLSSRFIALLSAGVPPEQILATTFTRKAAGEIFERVLWRLAEAAASSQKLAELAAAIGDSALSAARVRALLVQALGSLHRLRVGTLDSFFIQLAGSFTLELGLPPGWVIGEESEDKELREEAVEAVLGRDRSEELLTLFHLLTKGEARRGIGDLVLSTVNDLYGLFGETSPAAWRQLTASNPLAKEQLADLLGEIRSFDLTFSKSQAKARDSDLDKAVCQDWKELLKAGLCNKVLLKENDFNRKPIPPGLVKLYRRLIQHVEGTLVTQLVRQTEATHDLLSKFDVEYQMLKQSSGTLRFDEVTLALASSGTALPEQIAFRLDGQIEHLLLDEFQDTSFAQWRVLRPFAQRIAAEAPAEASSLHRAAPDSRPGSFFCVGDVKQAIYGWRGGLAEMFDALDQDLAGLTPGELRCSYRSAPQIIEVVNHVFTKMRQHSNLEQHQGAVDQFCSRFPAHTTAKTGLTGHITLQAAPLPQNGETRLDRLYAFAAEQVAALAASAPGRSIGILCRKNDVVARMIYELRQRKVEASEEGGNTLADSAAVEIILSLLRLGDHPGDTVARFHLASSPLGPLVGLKSHENERSALELSRAVRRALLENGYGAAIFRWAKALAPFCDTRDLSRLQQLVEMAYDYQPLGALRTDAFVNLVRSQRKSDPTTANIRVMTVHQSKGLEFDAVFLPELDARLIGQPPPFVAGRPSPLQPVDRVCRYAGSEVQKLLPPEWQSLFAQEESQRLRESLCVLYVAMTRAIHALHMIIAPPLKTEGRLPRTFAGLVRAALAPDKPLAPQKILFESGDPEWFCHPASDSQIKALSGTPSGGETGRSLVLAPPLKESTRGLVRASPSGLEGGPRVRLSKVLEEKSALGMSYGSLMHAWLERVRWLEEGAPADANLRRIAAQLSAQIGPLPAGLSAPLADFHKTLQRPKIASLLRRQFYDPWGKALTLETERELPFALRDGDQLLSGSIDRLVLISAGGKLIAADVVDYKTDTVSSPSRVSELVEHYCPQLEAYKRAVCKITGLPIECVTARLAFLSADEVVEV